MKITKIIIRFLWIFFLLTTSAIILIFVLINTETFGKMPDFAELENPETNIATQIFSDDGHIIGKFYKENRTVVKFKELSPNVVNALIATEDVRFYKHTGIDFKAVMRAVYGVASGNKKGGGSTITQQLAKNLFPRDTARYSNKVSYYAFTAIAKLKEWVTAVKLERNYTKQEIITMYLNTVPFGSNAHGINSAARTFFGIAPDSLRLEQAAVLVGLLKAPTYYSPKLNPKNALRRRNVVLTQIEKYQDKLNQFHGYKIQPKQYYDSLKQLPIKLNYSVQSHKTGVAPYFREFIRKLMRRKKPKRPKGRCSAHRWHNYLQDSIQWETNPLMGWCHKNKKPDGSEYNLYTDGLKIYTTINVDMQKYAEQAVKKHLSEYLQPLFFKTKKGNSRAPFSWKDSKKQIAKILYLAKRSSNRYYLLRKAGKDSAEIARIFNTPTKTKVFTWEGLKDTVMSPMDSIIHHKYYLRAGLMSMNPINGHVKAYVGGIDYKHFRYDHVNQARRQVGSTLKPIVYSVAMENGLYPCHKVPNIEVSFEMPQGSDQEVYTPRYSPNKRKGEMISLKYGLALSLNQVSAWVMKKYGPLEVVRMARRTGIISPLDTVPSLCVGAAEVRLSEMVAAYSTYANKGVHVAPVYVSRIEDRNGNIITRFASPHKEALNANTAYRMIELMRGVVDIGTSRRLRTIYRFTNQIAGKTGTTNDNSDGWFIGFVPNLITGVWVGGENRNIRFSSAAYGQGASMALPIWAYYMKSVYANEELNVSKAPFEKPDNYEEVDCDKYNQNESPEPELEIEEEEVF